MLEESRIIAGRWEGVWAGASEPAFQIVHQARALPGLACDGLGDGRWRLSLPIPVELLSDGVQTFLLQADGETVGSFTILSGQPLEADLRAELDLLRAELDLLKRAFRRHCVETAG
ncbi:hypothetical protein ACTTAI_20000 [Rhodobacter capsulatus]|uniref:hypothetical protein n=1 Tax=Rhodobacter capsulatus TaxID=1061 RepID=UPI0040283E36